MQKNQSSSISFSTAPWKIKRSEEGISFILQLSLRFNIKNKFYKKN